MLISSSKERRYFLELDFNISSFSSLFLVSQPYFYARLISIPFSCVLSWSTSDLRSQCHVTLTNTGRRELKGSVSVRQALYEARSGIVGGHIEIQELKMRGTREIAVVKC